MKKWEKAAKAAVEMDSLILRYKDAPGWEKTNAENFDAIKKILEDIGIYIDNNSDDGIIMIGVNGYDCYNKKTRSAGRRDAYGQVDYRKSRHGFDDICRYSDVVWMMQTMTDKQIATKIGMKIATYYRHKKALKETRYYKSLDLNRLSDLAYLQSVDGDNFF